MERPDLKTGVRLDEDVPERRRSASSDKRCEPVLNRNENTSFFLHLLTCSTP